MSVVTSATVCAFSALALSLAACSNSDNGEKSDAVQNGGEGSGASSGEGGSSNNAGGTNAGNGGDQGGGPDEIPSACSKVGADVPIAAGDSVSLLWDNGKYVIVFGNSTSNQSLSVATLDATGAVTSGPTVIDGQAKPGRTPSIAKLGDGYAVAWEEVGGAPNIQVRKLDGAGKPVSGKATIPATGAVLVEDGTPESRPALAVSSNGVAITWMDITDGTPSAYVGWLDEGLTFNAGSKVRIGEPGAGAGFPSIGGDPNDNVVVWADARDGKYDVRFAHAKPAGISDEQQIRSAASNAYLSRVTKTNFGYFAAWEDTRAGDTAVYMGLIDNSGAKFFEGIVEAGQGDANWPDVAWNGVATAVVYYQFRGNGQPKIYLTLIDPAGARVAGGGDLQVSDTPSGTRSRFPSISASGKGYGVAWIDAIDQDRQVRFARVSCE